MLTTYCAKVHICASFVVVLKLLYNILLPKGIRASVDALSRDGPGQISRERVQRGRLTRQGTTS